MASHAENKETLNTGITDELAKHLHEIGLGYVLERAVGGAASVIMILWSLVKFHIDKMRELALNDLRDKYGDKKIHLLGQQVAGQFQSEECWAFVHRVGGTIWVQHVSVTDQEGLALVVLWHPDPHFKPDKSDVIRIYRGSNQCVVDELVPAYRQGK